MRISVVTISFNQRAFLEACLASLLKPKDPALEYIVVDPGSTDGSRELIDSYGDAVDVRVYAPDDGPADGLNQGFARATGDYLYFLNSDDLLLPGGVAKMVDDLNTAGLPDLLLGCGWIIDGQGLPQRVLRPHGTTPQALLSGMGAMVQQGMVFKRSLFEAAGGFNTNNRTCWDLELLLDMLGHTDRIAHSQTRYAGFRLHDESLSGGAQGEAHNARYFADLQRIAEDHNLHAKPPSGSSRIGRILGKALGHPGWMLQDLADRLLPGRRARLWRADQAFGGAGQG